MKKYTEVDGIDTAMGLASVFIARAPNLIAAVDIASLLKYLSRRPRQELHDIQRRELERATFR